MSITLGPEPITSRGAPLRTSNRRPRFFGSAVARRGALPREDRPTIGALQQQVAELERARQVLVEMHNHLVEAYATQGFALTKAQAEIERLHREWIPRGVLNAISEIERTARCGRPSETPERRPA
jgi:hypothetical protein